MKVLALGGPGAMGAVAVRIAAGLAGIEEIVIADRDLGAAGRLARTLADAPVPVRALEVDVTEDSALRSALSGTDLVLNTVGPYYRFGPTVLRAAIETRTHYLDICDDWEPTLQVLELDAAAREQGVCAVIGMGASPGMSNLLAALAAAELDTVRDVYTVWPVDAGETNIDVEEQILGADGRPTAAAVHWMQQASGVITAVRAGALTELRPLRPIPLALPGGRSGADYSIGHPEPITLRRSLKPSGDAVNLMVLRRGTLAYLDTLRRDIDSGRLTNETAAAQLAPPTLLRTLRSIPTALRTKGPGNLPPFFALVAGVRHGRDLTVLAHPNLTGPSTDPIHGIFTDMARATGIPLALGMYQILDGSARTPGVHAPDEVIDPARFFADLGRTLGRDPGTPIYLVEQELTATAGR
ncbi:saccharopine dehydrogenase family protein [Nocardia crassostreae]|uniref:saccharopine dehydrogenase family protein n=1 Tax=Nocardia crassostreae TaxID=53428 RepID=UPI00082B4F69|nr:saccharopine dehydrogenase NADP-binding domain-containing protein [Nocardia crassostreae]